MHCTNYFFFFFNFKKNTVSEQNLSSSLVGTPFNVVHKSHVNFDYQWTGDNVAESFEYKEKLGQGYALQSIIILILIIVKVNNINYIIKTLYFINLCVK